MTDEKEKNCKRCHKDKPIGLFPNSPHSKDGKLGYCKPCWSTKMEIAAIGRATKGSKPKPKKSKKMEASAIHRAVNGKKTKITKIRPVVAKANAALREAGKAKESFLVRAGDKTMAFAAEKKALRQAMEWQMKGRAVTVWRQCEFEMVLRIVG